MEPLDKLLGHTRTEPILNWIAEKERWKALSFWDDVWGKVGLPEAAKVYHLHPTGVVNSFNQAACACGKDITEDQLQKISPTSSIQVIRSHLDSLNQGFSQFNIISCREKAHFLAQILHESDRLNAVKEYGGEQKSYSPWYGRGLIQLTLRANYLKYGAYIGSDVSSSEVNRNKLTQEPHSTLSAFWFYKVHKSLDTPAALDDFNFITAKINGGFNGYNDRIEYFNRASKILNTHHLSKLESPDGFAFENSGVYDSKIYSLAWGMWHDPSRNEAGVIKDRSKSLTGYRRARELILASPLDPGTPDKKIYGIRYTDVLPFINQRITSLSN
jgi:predicted chitinase